MLGEIVLLSLSGKIPALNMCDIIHDELKCEEKVL